MTTAGTLQSARSWTLVVDRRQMGMTLAVTLCLVWPLFGPPYDMLSTAVLAAEYLVVAMSLVLLTGFAGQISLCQATLVGVGGFASAIGVHKLGLHFPVTVVIGMLAGAGTAAVVGVVALRVRGLFFAVATLIFAYVADQYLFLQSWLVPTTSGVSIAPETIGTRGTIPYLQLADAHNFYYVALAAALFAVFAVANLRDSRMGRAFAALRGSEVAAASLGVDVVRVKLTGFAVAGSLAGLAGSLLLVGQGTIAPSQFSFSQSLYFLSIAVVGGLRSIGGAIASSVFFAVLVGEVFYRFPRLADYLDLISAVLLIVVLLFFQGGFGALPNRVRTALAARSAHRSDVQLAPATLGDELRGAATESDVVEVLGALGAQAGEATADGRRTPILLEAHDITVRFGGLIAVNGGAIRVGAGEIVGLIGPNGAGKTTMFNALLGLNSPEAGVVRLFGDDVSGWPVHRRASLGVGRTFQVIQLFGDLSVFDNLMVATHLQNSTGVLGSVFASPKARARERAAQERVDAVLRLMLLDGFADRLVADLPFGVLRLVEIARTLVTGAPLVCLDEPASGLDSGETERLVEMLLMLRSIGISILVIEHDVEMVTRLCDHIYVLDQGRMIADGSPGDIRTNPAVIASYLGSELTAEQPLGTAP